MSFHREISIIKLCRIFSFIESYYENYIPLTKKKQDSRAINRELLIVSIPWT